MAKWLRYVLVFASAFLLMLAVRTLVFSVHSISGNALAPLFQDGDQLLVNRCSYGLRIEGNGLLPYGRLLRQSVKKGDIVAFTIPNSSYTGIFLARCTAVPGDTLHTNKGMLTIPGLKTCADADYYWLESINGKDGIDSRYLGFIHEQHIIGRVVSVLYNRQQLSLFSRRP